MGEAISCLFEDAFSPGRDESKTDIGEPPRWRRIEPSIMARRKSGELFPAEVQFKLCRLETPASHVYLVRDVSLQVRQEQRIAELEREVSYLARHSLLGELATAITHELSQPLTAITNYTAAAGRCWSGAENKDIENGLALMTKAGEQSKRAWVIMHRLRKLLQHRGVEFTDEDLRLALEEAVQLATLGANHHGISVSVDMPADPVIVRMDRVQVQILLANLIRNAVDELRVTNGERKMWISLKIDEENFAQIRVEDTGPGIAPDVFENIFDPFLTTKPQGLGVGLAVSRRIALVHDGRLAAENRPEGGAAFKFIIPVSRSSVSENVSDE